MKNMSFESWFKKLQDIAVKDFGFSRKSAKTMDPKAWKRYFDDGLSPSDAIKEDISNA